METERESARKKSRLPVNVSYVDVDWLSESTLMIYDTKPFMEFWNYRISTGSLLVAAHTLLRPEFNNSVELEVIPLFDNLQREDILIEDVKYHLQHSTESFNNSVTPRNTPQKIILIRDADLLSHNCQKKLLNIIGTHQKYPVRFILSFSDISRFLVSFSSIFFKFSFKPLEQDEWKPIISHICTEQSLCLDKEALETISRASNRSLGKAIQLLEESDAVSDGDLITSEDVNKSTHFSREWSHSKSFLHMSLGDGNIDCSWFDHIIYSIVHANRDAGDMSLFLNEVLNVAISEKDVTSDERRKVLMCIVEAEKNIVDYDGDNFLGNVYLQLVELVFDIREAVSKVTSFDCENYRKLRNEAVVYLGRYEACQELLESL